MNMILFISVNILNSELLYQEADINVKSNQFVTEIVTIVQNVPDCITFCYGAPFLNLVKF